MLHDGNQKDREHCVVLRYCQSTASDMTEMNTAAVTPSRASVAYNKPGLLGSQAMTFDDRFRWVMGTVFASTLAHPDS